MIDTIFSASVSIVLILLLRKLFAGHVPARFIYALWLIPAIQLLLFGHSLYSESMSYDNVFRYEVFDNINVTPLQRISPNVYDALEETLNHVLVQGESFVPEVIGNTELARVRSGISVWEMLKIVWVIGAIITALCLFVPFFRTWGYLRKHRVPEQLHGYKVYLVKNLLHSCLFFGKIYIDSEQGKHEEWSPFIVRHESMHRKQGDDVWNLVRGLCVVMYWFHPLVWLAAFVSKSDSVYACDERTMRKMCEEEKRSYGKALLELVTMENYMKKEVFSYGIGGGKLKERIKRITAKEVRGKVWKRAAFFTGVLVLVVLIGVFAKYGMVKVVASNQYKKIQTYVTYPASEKIHVNSVTYCDGQLYTIIKSDTDEIYEVQDKWLEVEDDGLFNVVAKTNLQKKSTINFHGLQLTDGIIFCLGGKNVIDSDYLAEPGTRWAEVCASYDNKARFLVDSLTEVFGDNYSELKDGNYRMNYVLWDRNTDECELFCVPFTVQTER